MRTHRFYPPFKVFGDFEVEVATNNRDFRPERMEISKCGKRQKKTHKKLKNPKNHCLLSYLACKRRENVSKSNATFFAPEEVVLITIRLLHTASECAV